VSHPWSCARQTVVCISGTWVLGRSLRPSCPSPSPRHGAVVPTPLELVRRLSTGRFLQWGGWAVGRAAGSSPPHGAGCRTLAWPVPRLAETGKSIKLQARLLGSKFPGASCPLANPVPYLLTNSSLVILLPYASTTNCTFPSLQTTRHSTPDTLQPHTEFSVSTSGGRRAHARLPAPNGD